MNQMNERHPVELTPEEFLEKWQPKTETARAKADCMVDLERLALARTGYRNEGRGSAMADSDGFNWREQEALVVKRVLAIAVYKRPDGDIVIRQEQESGEDSVIVIPTRYAHNVVEAIQRQLKGNLFFAPPPPTPPA